MKTSDPMRGEIDLFVVHQIEFERSKLPPSPLTWSARAVPRKSLARSFLEFSLIPGVCAGLRRGLGVGLAVSALASSAWAITLTSDTRISSSNTNFDGADIVVTNCALTVDGAHAFASLQILNGAKLTHSFAPTGVLTNFISVSGEQHRLTAASTEPLNLANVVASTVVVGDLLGLTVYTNGADYQLLQTNGLTLIKLLAGSSIRDGSTNLVAYQAIGSTVQSQLDLAVAGDVWIAAGGSVDLDGVGYGPQAGPGAGSRGGLISPGGTGAGHGGLGGANSSGVEGGLAYDSVTQPISKGSGSGGPGNSGAAGGGAAKMVVGGTLRIDGRMSANGATGAAVAAGGGAGGSIWLTTHNLTGLGLVSADGGAGDPHYGGGGGGGRIALHYSLNAFSGALSARGGNGYGPGGAGTLYTKDSSQSVGQMVVDNAGRSGASTPIGQTALFDLTVQGAAGVTLSGAEIVGNLTLNSNAWMSLNGLSLTVRGDARLAAGTRIIADGAGYRSGEGAGAGRASSTLYGPVGSGGGYGGLGGSAGTAAIVMGGNAYGSLISPVDMGSGGGSVGGLAGTGGGAVRLNVTGALILNGRISADGGDGISDGAGGGSGGSVWLTVGTLAGAGAISANGGAGSGFGPYAGGGGGGGRIAIQNDLNLFFGVISAYGGSGATSGGGGTVYLKANNSSIGSVMVDNGGRSDAITAWPFGNTGALLDLKVLGGAMLTLSSSAVLNSLLVASNSWILVTNQNQAITVMSNATIQSGGGILADMVARGGSGVGRGGLASSGGGGYGGYGGYGSGGASAPGGMAYGAASAPADSGSGGGPVSGLVLGAPGGGFIRLSVSGTLMMNGKISANGGSGVAAGAGGGSGGGISVTVGTLTGDGTISANGGSGDGWGGGGGGGRIAVQFGANAFLGSLSASGGRGWSCGGAGTIYTKQKNAYSGQILIDNGGLTGTNTTWSTGAGGAIGLTIIGGAAVTLPAYQTITSLIVGSNSSLILPGAATLAISSNATVQRGGSILADGLGSAAGSGLGAGRSAVSESTFAGGGAGYGGYGGNCSVSASLQPAPSYGGVTYGNLTEPMAMGSGGGGNSSTGWGGAGGGAIRLVVEQTLQVDGRLSANGLSGTNGGGGSGGSIWLVVGTLSGAGVISANGGSGTGLSGGGGGGRIAIQYASNAFSGTVSAFGGGGYANGGAGTIYTRGDNLESGLVVIDNGGLPGTNTALGNSGSLDLIIRGGAVVSAVSPLVVGNLLIKTNGWLYVAKSLVVSVSSDATVEPGGGIQADGTGYASGQGSGAGRIYSVPSVGYVGGGGGYGGFGASGFSSAYATGGIGYGSMVAPVDPGSGGAGNENSGGAGGGALHLSVKGRLLLNGRISAEGVAGSYPGAGGGAGGSLWVSAGLFTGAGLISAKGGLGNGAGGAGGGGRIALEWGTNAFLGLLSAVGGGSDSGWGGAGTIFTKANARLSGQVLADNGGHPGTNTSLSPAASPFDLIVSGGAVVSPPSSALTLHSVRIADGGSICAPRSNFPLDLVVLADAAIETGGAIAVDGQGYLPGAGPGAGMSSGGVGSGAGYGGVGGASSTSPGGVSYGSVMQPSSFGSGGGLGVANSQNSVTGSTGGGALRLAIAGTLTVNGMIGAAGASGVGEAYGGGSGGSIWVNAGVVAGSGWIAADGGDGYPGLGGGGAGGRVAVYSPANLFQGDVSVHGGSGYAAGQDGSYYRSAVAPQVMAQAVAVDGKNVVLNWLGVAFVNYQVYYSTNLMDWQYYSGAGLGTNGPMQTLIYNDGQAAKFFRVQAGN